MNDGDIFELDVKRYRYDNEKRVYHFFFKNDRMIEESGSKERIKMLMNLHGLSEMKCAIFRSSVEESDTLSYALIFYNTIEEYERYCEVFDYRELFKNK